MFHGAIFPVLGWCSATRRWTQRDLREARSVQLRMSRQARCFWPKVGEETSVAHRGGASGWRKLLAPPCGTARL